jgi:ornithine cyclodeaminase/alanine dehydrogenase-like protein (mu-crystallin family)
MEFFDKETIEKAATFPQWVEAMEEALAAIVTGDFVLPKRMHLDRGNDTFLLMPCISHEYWTTKLVSFCPGNRESGKPSIYGTVILNNSNTGEPLAVLDGTKITAMRTAAVTAAGIKILSPAGINTHLASLAPGSRGCTRHYLHALSGKFMRSGPMTIWKVILSCSQQACSRDIRILR